MTVEQALKLAIQALEAERKRVAVDANFRDYLKADYPYAVKASKQREKINQAIMILKNVSIKGF